MKLSIISRTLCMTAFTIAASSVVAAQESGWYVGGNVGQARANIDNEGIARGLLSTGITATSITTDERDLGF